MTDELQDAIKNRSALQTGEACKIRFTAAPHNLEVGGLFPKAPWIYTARTENTIDMYSRPILQPKGSPRL